MKETCLPSETFKLCIDKFVFINKKIGYVKHCMQTNIQEKYFITILDLLTLRNRFLLEHLTGS